MGMAQVSAYPACLRSSSCTIQKFICPVRGSSLYVNTSFGALRIHSSWSAQDTVHANVRWVKAVPQDVLGRAQQIEEAHQVTQPHALLK